MTGGPPVLHACGHELVLGPEPWLMGIVNATPDSFSDAGLHQTLEERVGLAASLIAAGARLIDVGGESGVTNRPPVSPKEEIARVVPVIERLHAELRGVKIEPGPCPERDRMARVAISQQPRAQTSELVHRP